MNFKPKRIKERVDHILQKVKKDNPLLGYIFAKNRLKHRWPEAEPFIMQSPWTAVDYAIDVIKGRWSEAEPYIKKDSGAARYYAYHIIKDRWPEAESIIKQSASNWLDYKKRFKIHEL